MSPMGRTLATQGTKIFQPRKNNLHSRLCVTILSKVFRRKVPWNCLQLGLATSCLSRNSMRKKAVKSCSPTQATLKTHSIADYDCSIEVAVSLPNGAMNQKLLRHYFASSSPCSCSRSVLLAFGSPEAWSRFMPIAL